jgi:hypothetical protein
MGEQPPVSRKNSRPSVDDGDIEKKCMRTNASLERREPISNRGTTAFFGKGTPMSITKTIEPVWNCIDAARFLRLHPKAVKRLARLGQIPGRQLGRRWFFRPSDLDAILCGGINSSAKAMKVAPQLSP